MFDKYRMYFATVASPLIGFIAYYASWHYVGVLCDIGPGCLGWGILTLLLIPIYVVFASIFIATVVTHVKKHYIKNKLTHWVFIRKPLLISIVIVCALAIYASKHGLPNDIAGWIQTILVIMLPLIAVSATYSSWYFIAGRNNKAFFSKTKKS